MKQSKNYSISKESQLTFLNSKDQSLAGFKKLLNKLPNQKAERKSKKNKNNSSSNIFTDNNKIIKPKINKRDNKIRCSLKKTTSIRFPKLSNKYTSSNCNQSKHIKCISGTFDFPNPIPISFQSKYSENRNILKKNLEKIFQNKNHQTFARKQKAINEYKMNKYFSSDSESPKSLSSSISAHNKLFIDNKEVILNKYFSKFFKKLSDKTVSCNNWKLSQMEDYNNNYNKFSNIKKGSSQLIDDIFDLVKIFTKRSSPYCNTNSALKAELPSLDGSFYQKPEMIIHAKDDLNYKFQKNTLKYILTNLAIMSFNTPPNLFSEYLPTSIDQKGIITVSPIDHFNFSENVNQHFVDNLFFNDILEQVYNMNILFQFSSVESKVELKLFDKINTEFFKESLNIPDIDIHRSIDSKQNCTPNNSNYSYNEEFETNFDLISWSSKSDCSTQF